MPSSALVIGCSEQLPNELRAYRVMGTSTEGAVLLSRHGATYSAAAGEVTPYPELLERMLGLVLANLPSSLRERARPALISRWNRDWGIEAEDVVATTVSSQASKSLGTSSSPFANSLPMIEYHVSVAPRAAVAG